MTCSHYFILPPPSGVVSIGVCKLCGEKRDMFNWVEGKYQGWGGKSKKDNEKDKTMLSS